MISFVRNTVVLPFLFKYHANTTYYKSDHNYLYKYIYNIKLTCFVNFKVLSYASWEKLTRNGPRNVMLPQARARLRTRLRI